MPVGTNSTADSSSSARSSSSAATSSRNSNTNYNPPPPPPPRTTNRGTNSNSTRDFSTTSVVVASAPAAVVTPAAAAPYSITGSDSSAVCGESTIDAAHIHFRERLGPQQTYRCHTCNDRFQAHSLLAVMEHFVRHSSTCSAFHSACLYCGGKVHSYHLETRRITAAPNKIEHVDHNIDDDNDDDNWTMAEVGAAGGGQRYYHDCARWRRRQDR